MQIFPVEPTSIFKLDNVGDIELSFPPALSQNEQYLLLFLYRKLFYKTIQPICGFAPERNPHFPILDFFISHLLFFSFVELQLTPEIAG